MSFVPDLTLHSSLFTFHFLPPQRADQPLDGRVVPAPARAGFEQAVGFEAEGEGGCIAFGGILRGGPPAEPRTVGVHFHRGPEVRDVPSVGGEAGGGVEVRERPGDLAQNQKRFLPQGHLDPQDPERARHVPARHPVRQPEGVVLLRRGHAGPGVLEGDVFIFSYIFAVLSKKCLPLSSARR